MTPAGIQPAIWARTDSVCALSVSWHHHLHRDGCGRNLLMQLDKTRGGVSYAGSTCGKEADCSGLQVCLRRIGDSQRRQEHLAFTVT